MTGGRSSFVEHDSYGLRHLRQAGFTKQLNNYFHCAKFGPAGHFSIASFEFAIQGQEDRFGLSPQERLMEFTERKLHPSKTAGGHLCERSRETQIKARRHNVE
jgi:hypothetical protein